MKRNIIESLKNWKNSINRKPLILYGAHQVGKTWILKEFGSAFYKQFLYLNFDDNKELGSYFEKDLDPERIISAL
jgi:predicted AAA+ superfamily ATPase